MGFANFINRPFLQLNNCIQRDSPHVRDVRIGISVHQIVHRLPLSFCQAAGLYKPVQVDIDSYPVYVLVHASRRLQNSV